MGCSLRILAVISCTASTGNASGAGFPAEKGMTAGSDEYFRISRIAEGFRFCTRSAKA